MFEYEHFLLTNILRVNEESFRWQSTGCQLNNLAKKWYIKGGVNNLAQICVMLLCNAKTTFVEVSMVVL